MNGQIRLTEQGEVIASKYAHPEIGRRNLETLVAATLEATLLQPTKTAPKAFLDAADAISAASMAAYRTLVYETPGFTDYFFAATPIREIAELNIGSRPASRKATRAHRGPARDSLGLQLGPVPRGAARLVRLRLGDRGLRSATSAGSARSALALLQQMHRQWPFFRTLLSNMDMVLAKSDLRWPRATSSWSRTSGSAKRIFARDRGRVAAHRARRWR